MKIHFRSYIYFYFCLCSIVNPRVPRPHFSYKYTPLVRVLSWYKGTMFHKTFPFFSGLYNKKLTVYPKISINMLHFKTFPLSVASRQLKQQKMSMCAYWKSPLIGHIYRLILTYLLFQNDSCINSYMPWVNMCQISIPRYELNPCRDFCAFSKIFRVAYIRQLC